MSGRLRAVTTVSTTVFPVAMVIDRGLWAVVDTLIYVHCRAVVGTLGDVVVDVAGELHVATVLDESDLHVHRVHWHVRWGDTSKEWEWAVGGSIVVELSLGTYKPAAGTGAVFFTSGNVLAKTIVLPRI